MCFEDERSQQFVPSSMTTNAASTQSWQMQLSLYLQCSRFFHSGHPSGEGSRKEVLRGAAEGTGAVQPREKKA